MTSPLEVRQELVDALQLDLIGPSGPLGDQKETLTQMPSRWYLTGFLVPTDADEDQRTDPTCNDELDQAAEPAGLDDDTTPEKTAARRSYLPSSMGMSGSVVGQFGVTNDSSNPLAFGPSSRGVLFS